MANCNKCRNRFTCSEGMQEVLSANCTKFKSVGLISTPPDPQPSEPKNTCNCETCVKSRMPKPLAQYLAEYLRHEIVDVDRDLLKQALDAYESTEQVKIRIEPA